MEVGEAACEASLDYFKLIREISGVGLIGAKEHRSEEGHL